MFLIQNRLVVFCFLYCCRSLARGKDSDTKPNIVFILSDDQDVFLGGLVSKIMSLYLINLLFMIDTLIGAKFKAYICCVFAVTFFPQPVKVGHTTGVWDPYSFRTVVWVLLRPARTNQWKCCETGPTVFRPYPRRLESLNICRCHFYKGSTFFLVI